MTQASTPPKPFDGDTSLIEPFTIADMNDEVRMLDSTYGDGELGHFEDDDRVALYQRLHDLEEVTNRLLTPKSKLLQPGCASYGEVDVDDTISFDIVLDNFSTNDVLCLTVESSPSYMSEEFLQQDLEDKKVFRSEYSANALSEMKKPGLDVIITQTSRSHGSPSNQTNLSSASAYSSSTASTYSPSSSSTQLPDQKIAEFKSNFFHGEYSFALTTAHGMTPGKFELTVSNPSDHGASSTHSFKVIYHVLESVRATAIQANQKMHGNLGPDEMIYYRFMITDPKQMVSIFARPTVNSERGHKGSHPIGDPDLYVTNKFEGLVCANKDSYTWKSINSGSDRIDIHPDDIELGRGNHLVIGVTGYQERNAYEVEVVTSFPPTIRSILPDTVTDIPVEKNKYSYFSIDIDNTCHGKLLLVLKETPKTLHTSSSPPPSPKSPSEKMKKEDKTDASVVIAAVKQNNGRSVYCTDSLATRVINLDNISLENNDSLIVRPGKVENSEVSKSRNEKESLPAAMCEKDNDENSLSGKNVYSFPSLIQQTDAKLGKEALYGGLPPSSFKSIGMYPVMYLSSNLLYPTAFDYGWRASSIDGTLYAILEINEWKFCSERCYFSIYGAKVPTATEDGDDRSILSCRLEVQKLLDHDGLSETAAKRAAFFQELFFSVDGANTSQRERARLYREEQQYLTYGEIEYLPFVQILKDGGAMDGTIFYDLGSGAGKALVAAALSGITFLKCIGIELLPGLCEVSKDVIINYKDKVDNNSLNIYNSLLEVREGDVLVEDWTDADFLYISSVCFSDSMIDAVFEKAKQLKSNSVIATLKLPTVGFTFVQSEDETPARISNCGFYEYFKEEWYKMSWGKVGVYFIRRTNAVIHNK